MPTGTVAFNYAKMRQLREERGYSMRELAKLAGVTTNTIAELELGPRRGKGLRNANPETRRKIAQVLGVTPDVLLAR